MKAESENEKKKKTTLRINIIQRRPRMQVGGILKIAIKRWLMGLGIVLICGRGKVLLRLTMFHKVINTSSVIRPLSPALGGVAMAAAAAAAFRLLFQRSLAWMTPVPYSRWSSVKVCFLITFLALIRLVLLSRSARLKGLWRVRGGTTGEAAVALLLLAAVLRPSFFNFSSSVKTRKINNKTLILSL